MQPKPIIKVNSVSKYIQGKCILDSVSFEVQESSLVSIVGPNGAGKSTLVNIILGIDKNFDGSVEIYGPKDISYLPQLHAQDHYQLPMSVFEYLSVGSTPLYHPHRSDISFTTALAHVGISENVLHESVTTLSGGERQRVAIARALLSTPRILVLDEPLASVDYASRKGLYELIAHLSTDHGITVILVSHDLEFTTRMSDQVLCLNQSLHPQCKVEQRNTDSLDFIHQHPHGTTTS